MKKIILVCSLAAFCFNLTVAQETEEKSPNRQPHLNGHYFPSVGSFKNSFICTSLKIDIGYGSKSKIKIPGFYIQDYEIFSFEGRLAFLNLDVQYKQPFNSWLALYFNYKLSARLGTDMSTILVDGVNTLYGGEIGWLIKIFQSQKVNLSGSVGIRNFTGNFINVTQYFKDLINHVEDPKVVNVIPSLSGGGGLYLAYAISPTFGLQASAGYAYGESFIRDAESGYYNAVIFGDVDFNPAFRIPIGLTLGYSRSSLPELLLNNEGESDMFIGMLSYSGSDNFELSFVSSHYSMELSNIKKKTYISNFAVTFIFYF